jgi:anti-sigma factor RsiW
MKSCTPDVLSAYLDGALTLPARVRLEEHVKACTSCYRELDALRRVDELLAVWGARRAPMPITAEKRIITSVSRRRRLGPVLTLSRMMPAAVGSSVAAVLVVFGVNAGILFSNPAMTGTPVASPSTARVIVKQSQPLTDTRRTNAIFGSHVHTQPSIPLTNRGQSTAV